MPNILDASGLQVKTRDELVTYFTDKYVEIYGPDINLASDTPDGQMLNIQVQAILDNQDLLVQVYNSFDPDNAVGVVLDQRVALNGIERRAGTYTETLIRVSTEREVTLYGLDQSTNTVYTVSDNAGNRWFLKQTVYGLTAGVHQLTFRAAEPGAQLTIIGTISNQVTIVLGVTEVLNTNSYSTLGENEEDDASLRIRRRRSVAITSQGFVESLKAALENLPNVNTARVFENENDFIDADGIPPHSIWVIVDNGGATSESIARTIYAKRGAGSGMKGDQTYDVQRPDGSSITIRWDNVESQNVFIFLTLGSIDGVTPPNVGEIRSQIPALYHLGSDQRLNVTTLGTIVQQVDPNAYVISAGFSTGLVQHITFDLIPTSGYFMMSWNSYVTSSINYLDTAATVQTKLRALPGLETCTVTGSISGRDLAVTITSNSLYSIDQLLLVALSEIYNNSTRVLITTKLDLSNFVTPNSKKRQFALNPATIVMLPLQLNPSNAVIDKNRPIKFTPAGGYGTYTYTMDQNFSGSSVDVGGNYVSGNTAGTDIIRVRDQFGNTSTAVVTVI